MDKKQVAILVVLGLFTLLWYSVILPSLPKGYRPLNPDEIRQAQLASGNSLSVPASGNMSAGDSEISTVKDDSDPSQKQAEASETEKSEPAAVELPLVARNSEISIETDTVIAVFDNKGAVLTKLELKDYHPSPKTQENDRIPLLLLKGRNYSHGEDDSNFAYDVVETETGVRLDFKAPGKNKSFIFTQGSYVFRIEADGISKLSFPDVPEDGPAGRFRSLSGAMFGVLQGDYSGAGTVLSLDSLKKEKHDISFSKGDLAWAGFRGKYFLCIHEPDPITPVTRLNIGARGKDVVMELATEEGKIMLNVIAGPAKLDLLMPRGDTYAPLFNYTGFDVIIHMLLWILGLFHNTIGLNMGLSIILLTVVVRGLMFPINLKAQTSMAMMQEIQPEIKKLQAIHKNDKQAMAQAQMKLFKEYGANPMTGCLPMFIQMPVFISLFSAIGEGFIMRHQPFFGWITDLSAADHFMEFNVAVPFLAMPNGHTYLNILPLLYVITMYIQQSMMPKAAEAQQQQAQKMMKIMMFGFAFILYNYSSGLMLYWVGSNLWSIGESWLIRNRIMPRIRAEIKKKKKD